jgi:hypothetical protein
VSANYANVCPVAASTAARRQPVGAWPPLLLVEQRYGVRDAGDEPAHAGKQQQFLDKPGHDVLPGSGSR